MPESNIQRQYEVLPCMRLVCSKLRKPTCNIERNARTLATAMAFLERHDIRSSRLFRRRGTKVSMPGLALSCFLRSWATRKLGWARLPLFDAVESLLFGTTPEFRIHHVT